MVGQKLGHYKILDKLGQGGMGVVYRAEDTTLKRQVALKVLPAELAEDQERLQRFQREAETLAALDHPNIVHIYTVEEAEGLHFLTMQLVKGERLTDSIVQGGMPLDRLLKIAVPLAGALADAHEQGVVHRDLKPGNIMVTTEGRVKILDFGLAKLKQASEPGLASQFPTEPLTEEGRPLGTAPYMSPEQIEGRALDSRSDIFSLGIVIYEMASGRRPFEGESSTSTMAKILQTEPAELGALRPDLPPEFLRIVRRCLRKKPEDRYNDTRDFLVALKDLQEDSASGFSGEFSREARARPASRLPRWAIGGTLAAVALAAVAVAIVVLRPAVEGPPSSPVAVRHTQITFSGDATHPEISPDGAFLAAHSENGIVVRDIEGQSSLNVLETDSLDLTSMRWSSDGLQLLVSGLFAGERRSLVMPRLGGRQRSLRPYGYMCWSPDGSQVAGAWQNLKSVALVDVESGEVARTIDLEGAFRWISGIDWSLPTGSLLAITIDDDGGYAIWIVSSTGQDQAKIFETEREILSARWSLSDPTIYFLLDSGPDADLWRIKVAADSSEPRGSAEPLLTGLKAGPTFSVSRDEERLAYTRTASFSTIWKTDLEKSPDGVRENSTPIESGTQPSGGFSISPDSQWIALSKGSATDSDIFLLSLQDGSTRQLTDLDGRNAYPVWSPDGRTVAFGSTHDKTRRIRRVAPMGGTAQVLDAGELSTTLALAWAPGERLLYQQLGNNRWGLLDVESGDEEPLLGEDLSESGWFFDPVYSPDGAQVALYANLGGGDVVSVPVGGPNRSAVVLSSETGARRGSVFQAFPAAGHEGRSMRLRAKVRVSGEESRGRLLLKVKLRSGETGFRDSMRDRPIVATDWSDYELAGLIDEDATEIIFGGWLHGAGAAWFDEFDLSVRDDAGEWMTLPIENPGFEAVSGPESPPGWRTLAPTAVTFNVTSQEPSPSGKALEIRALGPTPASGEFYPVGWSRDGEYVYLVEDPYFEANPPVIYRVPSGGGPVETYLDLELSEDLKRLKFSANGEFLIVETARQQSDLWIAEGFDPDPN